MRCSRSSISFSVAVAVAGAAGGGAGAAGVGGGAARGPDAGGVVSLDSTADLVIMRCWRRVRKGKIRARKLRKRDLDGVGGAIVARMRRVFMKVRLPLGNELDGDSKMC